MAGKNHLHVEITKSADKDFDAQFIMSAGSPDRVNDTIARSAYAAIDQEKLIALWQHNQENPIGYWHSIKGVKDTLQGKLKLASTRLASMVRQLIDDGVPLAASIGFRGQGEPNDEGGFHFKEIELLECSVVSTPAHPRAVQIAKSFGFEPNILGNGASIVTNASPGTSAPETIKQTSKQGNRPMNLAERIQAAEKRLNQLRDRAVAITEQFDQDEADTDALQGELKTVNADIEKADDLVSELKKTEANIASRSEPVQPAPVTKAPNLALNIRKNKEPENALDVFTKMAVAELVSHRDRCSVPQALEQTYSDSEYLKDVHAVMRQKSVAGDPPLNTYTAGAAAELVAEATNSFIEAITVESLAAALGSRCRPIAFNGRSSAKLTRRNPTGLSNLTEPSWIHEGRPYPVQAMGVGQQTVERGKIGSIIPFTLELLESNLVADLETEIRTAMVEAAAVRLDNTFFSNVAAVTRVHPAGLLNGVTALGATAGGGIDAVSTDVQNMFNALTTARLGARPVLVLNSTDRMAAGFFRTALGDMAFRDELASGQLMGIPVIDGPTLPQHTAVMVDAAYIGFGLDTPAFAMSTEAPIVALNADDTDPTMAGGRADGALGGNTAGTVIQTAGVDLHTAAAAAAPAYSLFQTYGAALRLTQFGGWAPIAAGAVQAIAATTWTT